VIQLHHEINDGTTAQATEAEPHPPAIFLIDFAAWRLVVVKWAVCFVFSPVLFESGTRKIDPQDAGMVLYFVGADVETWF
jgi:hypothetical protein